MFIVEATHACFYCETHFLAIYAVFAKIVISNLVYAICFNIFFVWSIEVCVAPLSYSIQFTSTCNVSPLELDSSSTLV